MNAEAILEAVKAYAKTCIKQANKAADYERGEASVARRILTLIAGLEREEDG